MVDLEINKGINDEYLWVLHGSDVELHVGEPDQQELEQQGLSNLVGRDRGFIMMRLSDYVVSGLHDKLGTLRKARLLLAEYICAIIIKELVVPDRRCSHLDVLKLTDAVLHE